MADPLQILIEGANRIGDTAVAVLEGAVNVAITHGPGAVASVGGAVAHGVSEINDAARSAGEGIVAAVTPAVGDANPFAALLNGVDLGWASQPQQAQSHEASLADLGDFGAQLSNLNLQRQSAGISMA